MRDNGPLRQGFSAAFPRRKHRAGLAGADWLTDLISAWLSRSCLGAAGPLESVFSPGTLRQPSPSIPSLARSAHISLFLCLKPARRVVWSLVWCGLVCGVLRADADAVRILVDDDATAPPHAHHLETVYLYPWRCRAGGIPRKDLRKASPPWSPSGSWRRGRLGGGRTARHPVPLGTQPTGPEMQFSVSLFSLTMDEHTVPGLPPRSASCMLRRMGPWQWGHDCAGAI